VAGGFLDPQAVRVIVVSADRTEQGFEKNGDLRVTFRLSPKKDLAVIERRH
jgi:hypothetical protein